MSDIVKHEHHGGGLPSWSIRRPIGTVMLTATLLILGLVFVGRLPVDLLPVIEYPQVRVNVSYPGVEPVVLEEIIAKPIEAAVAVTEKLTRLETQVNEGWVSVGLHFDQSVDVDFALQDVAKNVERVRGRLPEDADPPQISKEDPTPPVRFPARSRSVLASAYRVCAYSVLPRWPETGEVS